MNFEGGKLVASPCLQPFQKQSFIAWNLPGSLDLVLAMTFGVLASASPIGILAGDVSTRLMGQFPLSLFPTFLVPSTLITHLIALSRARKETLGE